MASSEVARVVFKTTRQLFDGLSDGEKVSLLDLVRLHMREQCELSERQLARDGIVFDGRMWVIPTGKSVSEILANRNAKEAAA